MTTWQERRTSRYQVRTQSGRKLHEAENVESAETVAMRGRERSVYIWIGGRYVHYQTY